MKTTKHWALTATGVAVLALFGCAASQKPESPAMSVTTSPEVQKDNPLLQPWTGPYGGVPGFAGVQVGDFEPGLERAMDDARQDVAAIVNSSEAPTFENTCAAFENMGRTLQRVSSIYNVWESTLNGPEFQAVDREMSPRLAAFRDEIVQNEKLFQRIAAVYESADKSGWTPEQQRLAWRQYTDLVLAGAKLGTADKARLAEINQRLATLFTSFSQNVLSDEETYTVVLENEAELAGLPDSVRASAAAAAESHELAGKWLITNTRS